MPSNKVAAAGKDNRIKLSKERLDKILRTPHPTRVEYFDMATPGLCIRVGPRAASWYYMRRVDGRLVRLMLGTDAELAAIGKVDRRASFTVARERVGQVESEIAAGKHPRAEQARQRAELVEARRKDEDRLIHRVAEAWADSHLPDLAPATAADYRRSLEDFVAAYGDADIGTLTRGQIKRHLDTVKARSPYVANRTAVVIRLLCAFAADRFDLPADPATGIKNPARPKARKRTLDPVELRVLWTACERAGYPYGHALRLAICTGQRIGEVGNVRRSDIDGTGDYWEQTENKSGQRIDIYLASHARAILSDCPDFGRDAPYFTAGTPDEEDPKGEALRGIHSDRWNKIIPRHIEPHIAPAAEALGVDPIAKYWTPHDLRRTVRTALTGWCIGVSPDTAERVLNHSIGGLRAVYDHADYRPHVTDALRVWDAELSRVVAGEPTSQAAGRNKIVPIKRKRRA